MRIERIWSVYFSPTGTTRRVVSTVAEQLAEAMGAKYHTFDFTLPQAREVETTFQQGDLVVFGTPVYAGRVPNVLLKYLGSLSGNGALAVPVVLYGNRNYDDALIELQDILEKDGFHTVAAAAFVGEHAFSHTLAQNRPDQTDMAFLQYFTDRIVSCLSGNGGIPSAPVEVEGTPYPYQGYYQPRDSQGNAIDIRKVKPKTDEHCTGCGLCAQICPMGSISWEDVKDVAGICIKCGACIKRCPVRAKYYDDEGYLYHRRELEEMYAKRIEPEAFFI